jgi:hypothetical protein
MVNEKNVENIIAAVERRDRTSEIYINDIYGSALDKLAAAMQEPLPTLRRFYLRSTDDSVPILPDTFLGGSAPRLQLFILDGIPFPSFPRFILSSTHIVDLHLVDIPHSGYISPDAMATCLATLPDLKYLVIGFRSPLSRPLQIGLPPLPRAVLPALVGLSFRGASEYFEDFLARTHTPLLKRLIIKFFMDLIFDIPQLHGLIVRGERLRPLSPTWVAFGNDQIRIILGLPTRIVLTILCEERDWQLSSLAQVCNEQLPLLALVDQLSVCELYRASLNWKDDMDSSQWFELFRPFVAVQNLYVSKQFVPFVTASLRELTGERTLEVLPALKYLFLEGFQPSGSVQEAMRPFLSARQLSGYPVIIHSEPPQAHPTSFLEGD